MEASEGGFSLKHFRTARREDGVNGISPAAKTREKSTLTGKQYHGQKDHGDRHVHSEKGGTVGRKKSVESGKEKRDLRQTSRRRASVRLESLIKNKPYLGGSTFRRLGSRLAWRVSIGRGGHRRSRRKRRRIEKSNRTGPSVGDLLRVGKE